ncbi:hypothetical protein HH212_19965 [Massilia forsythiae]|uniref:Tle cognate immunity protein 4 C-terminal domain-containing protein n=1 Tax=Massilia forsythiae TaxID=2728020 RepID=A0A7Z2VZG7_9BURK|nr:T6SS immunity protein Tli4 family protein [Massilia forsythiae]QJE02013.1 hypothetical protein HH212_19965 [Massilia forsythiae]
MNWFKRMLLFVVWVSVCSACSKHQGGQVEKIAMKKHRIGRLMLDLPEEFVIDEGASTIIVPKQENPLQSKMRIEVISGHTNVQEFMAAVAERKSKLSKSGTEVENALKMSSVQPGHSILFRIMKVDDVYISELDCLAGEAYIRITANSYHGKFEQAEKSLLHFVSKIVQVDDATGDDFCIGPVCIKGANETESAEFVFRSTSRPDLRVDISVDTYKRDSDDALLTRMASEDSLVKVFDLKHRVLRKGEIMISDMHMQEWLGAAKMGKRDDELEYGFSLETVSSHPDTVKPFIHIEFVSGQYDKGGKKQPNSLNDAQALQMWDKITRSIQPVAK